MNPNSLISEEVSSCIRSLPILETPSMVPVNCVEYGISAIVGPIGVSRNPFGKEVKSTNLDLILSLHIFDRYKASISSIDFCSITLLNPATNSSRMVCRLGISISGYSKTTDVGLHKLWSKHL